MKVKELIKLLKKVNPEFEVVLSSFAGGYYPAEHIVEGKYIEADSEYLDPEFTSSKFGDKPIRKNKINAITIVDKFSM